MPPFARSVLAVATALALALGASPASAEDAPVALEWHAPSECPTREAVLARVAALLRGGASAPHAVVARATASRHASAWHVDVAMTIDRARGARSFDSDSCASVANAAAFALALAVDPTRAPSVASSAEPTGGDAERSGASAAAADEAPSRAEPTRPEPTRVEPARAPPPAAPREEPAPRRAASDERLAASASAFVDAGAFPKAAVGAELAIAWRPRPFRAEIAGVLLPTQEIGLDAAPGARGTFSLVGAATRFCYAPRIGRVEVGPCVALELDRASVSGAGLATTRSDAVTWASGGALGFAALTFRPITIRLMGGALLPLARPDFVVLQRDPSPPLFVHRASFFDLRCGLGLEARFL